MGTTSQKIQYLGETKDLLKNGINSLGGEITSQTTFRQYATELDSIYSSLPKVSGTGTSLSLSPTLKGRLGSVLKGNTFQQTYTGKNLLPYENTTQTLHGVTITHNQDGSITINGTSTQGFSYQLFNGNKKILDTTKNYVLSTQIEMPDKSFLRLQNANNSNVFVDVKSETGTVTQKKYIKFNGSAINNEDVRCFLYLYGNYTFNNYTIYPMLEEGTTMTSYEPYVGGTASPNPDYPQEIKSVTGLQKVSVEGKNLLVNEAINTTINGVTFVKNEDSSITANSSTGATSNTFYKIGDFILSAGTYNLSSTTTCPSNAYFQLIELVTGSPVITTLNGLSNRSFTINETKNLRVYLRISSGTTLSNFTVFPMIENNSTFTSYEPYQTPQEYEINLGTIKLNKIGDYQDYITGTIDNWSIKRQIGNRILNGSETGWARTGNIRFYCNNLFVGIKNEIGSISNYYIRGNTETTNNTFGISSAGRIYIRNDNITEVNNFKTWLSTHNTQVDYVLAEETTEAITNQEIINQLNEIYYLQSYNGTTNITITSEDLELIMTASALKGEA